MSTSGESRPGLISDDVIAQDLVATGRGGDENVVANCETRKDDTYTLERLPYRLYDSEQHVRAKVAYLVLGLFGAFVLVGTGVLALMTLAGKPGELISTFLLAALVPLSALMAGIGGFYFGQKIARRLSDGQ